MKKPMLVVAMLAMVLVATVPALAQMEEFTVTPAEEPVVTCEWVPTEPTKVISPENPYGYGPGASNPFDHSPGEFIVSYHSEEAMWATPQENVAKTSPRYGPDSPYMQLLRFEDIASIPDPCERFAAEEAKRQEILYSWPGVKYAEYNGLAFIDDPVGPSE